MNQLKISAYRASSSTVEMWTFAVRTDCKGISVVPYLHRQYPAWPDHAGSVDMDPADVPQFILDQVRQSIIDSIRFDGCKGGAA